MNKSFSLVFSLLIAFALFFSTVLPVSAAGLTLSTVSASRSGKVKLTFEVDGAPPASSNTGSLSYCGVHPQKPRTRSRK
jgi:hypothetical protein